MIFRPITGDFKLQSENYKARQDLLELYHEFAGCPTSTGWELVCLNLKPRWKVETLSPAESQLVVDIPCPP
jgi:hypothetical protein